MSDSDDFDPIEILKQIARDPKTPAETRRKAAVILLAQAGRGEGRSVWAAAVTAFRAGMTLPMSSIHDRQRAADRQRTRRAVTSVWAAEPRSHLGPGRGPHTVSHTRTITTAQPH